MRTGETPEAGPYLSVSDLAEWAYCPRAYWYRGHPPPGPVDRSASRSSRRGEAYHRRALTGVRRRDSHAGALVGLVVAGAILLLLVLLTAGVLR